MTRINCGIKPELLTKPHLLAEHREIKRIPNNIRKGKYNLNDVPAEFKLGSGHVKFFYDKLLYLKNRYEEIYNVCLNKKLNVTYFGDAWDGCPNHLMNDYIPSQRDIDIVSERLMERDKTYENILS